MPLPINSVAQAFTEQQQRQANIGDTQANTLQRLMDVAFNGARLDALQKQQQAADQMRNWEMAQSMYQSALGPPNASDPNARSIAQTQAENESAVDKSVRTLEAQHQQFWMGLKKAQSLGDEEAIKQYRILFDNTNTQLREARKEQLADYYRKNEYLGGLAYNAESPEDVSHFVQEYARIRGPQAAAQLVAGGNGVPGLRSDPNDPQKFLFGPQEVAALNRVYAATTKAKDQAQVAHWGVIEDDAQERLVDRRVRTASLIAERNARIAAKQHGVQLPGGTGNLEATPGAKVASIDIRPEGSPVTESDMRQMQNDIARDAGAGSPATAAATGVAGYGVDYTGMDARRQATVDWYATMQLAGDSTWRVGLSRSKQGSELIKAVDERVPEKAAELGLSAADIGTNKAIRVSNQAALTQITKDIATLKPYVNMLDQNSDILAGLADKAIATDSALANRPINWLRTHATDNPDVAEYLAQIEIVKNEATRVISNPRLVGQMTDTARQEIEAIINGTMPINATKRVLERIKNDGDRRIGTMETQQKHIQSTLKEMFPTGAGGAKQEVETPAPQKKVIKWSDLP